MTRTAFEARHVGIIISLSPICPSRHLANWLQREYLRSSGASEAARCPRHRTH
jgi:hypothetical protein